jgi:hypothetical protein
MIVESVKVDVHGGAFVKKLFLIVNTWDFETELALVLKVIGLLPTFAGQISQFKSK